MDKTPAFYIFLELLIGALLGLAVGAVSGNAIHGLQLGAMAGVFIGWIMTAPVLQK